MQQIISSCIILCFLVTGLSYSCLPTPSPKPLRVMHKLGTDTLKVLLRGSPPFVLELRQQDSTVMAQTMDSTGIMKLPISALRQVPGQYTAKVTNQGSDTTFSFMLEEVQKIAAKKDRLQKSGKTQNNTIRKRAANTTASSIKKRTSKKTSMHGEWSEWARHDCFTYIWYRYRVWKYHEHTKSYTYEYQLYNDYEIRVIFTEALIEPEDRSELQNLVASGGDLTRRMHQQWLDGKDYSGRMKVKLLTKNPFLFIWRLQAYTPTHPYANCD